jgi:hypothetical protein
MRYEKAENWSVIVAWTLRGLLICLNQYFCFFFQFLNQFWHFIFYIIQFLIITFILPI